MKHVIFDLGAVMFEWNPKAIAENFTSNVELQNRIQTELFFHKSWMNFDCGLVNEQQAIAVASKQLSVSLEEAERLFAEVKESLILILKTKEVLIDVKNNKMNAYCLSNISPELFNYLFEQHDLFGLFNGIVTSGVEHVGKPGKHIFEILLDRNQLKAEECLFIDDSAANTKTATELGILRERKYVFRERVPLGVTVNPEDYL